MIFLSSCSCHCPDMNIDCMNRFAEQELATRYEEPEDDVADFVGVHGRIEALMACDETDGNLTYAQITEIKEYHAQGKANRNRAIYRSGGMPSVN